MGTPLLTSTILIEDKDSKLGWDFIPDKFKLLRFDTVDILNIAPFFIIEDQDFIFGGYGGTKDNPTGLLTKQFEWIVRTARLQNPNVKIIVEQFYGNEGNYLKLDNEEKIGKYTDSVAHFLSLWQNKTYHDAATNKTVSLRVDGYDVDYEWTKENAGNQQPWAPEVLSQIRSKVDALNASPNYLVTLTPASTTGLTDSGKDLSKVFDYVVMQNYDGGSGTTPDHYLQAIPGLKPSQLIFGITAEVVERNLGTVRSIDAAISAFQKEYKGTTETGPLAGLFVWRLNSDDWVFENMALLALYGKLKNIPTADGLEESVNRGFESNAASRANPCTQDVWVSMDGYRSPVHD